MKDIVFYNKPNRIKQFSKDMKKDETPAEYALRRKLKAKQLNGHKFHRQKPIFLSTDDTCIDKFIIADFYNHPSKLIIEIDGSVHNIENIKKYDIYREKCLKEAGYNIIRFTNDEVMTGMDKVLVKILNEVENSLNTLN